MNTESSIILFDGICNLCNGTVNFVLKRNKKNQFQFVSLQSDEGRVLLKNNAISPTIDSVVLIHQDTVYVESDAVIEICRILSFPWSSVAILKIIPKKMRDKIYRFIATNRYRWFGKRETCRIIPSEKL